MYACVAFFYSPLIYASLIDGQSLLECGGENKDI